MYHPRIRRSLHVDRSGPPRSEGPFSARRHRRELDVCAAERASYATRFPVRASRSPSSKPSSFAIWSRARACARRVPSVRRRSCRSPPCGGTWPPAGPWYGLGERLPPTAVRHLRSRSGVTVGRDVLAACGVHQVHSRRRRGPGRRSAAAGASRRPCAGRLQAGAISGLWCNATARMLRRSGSRVFGFEVAVVEVGMRRERPPRHSNFTDLHRLTGYSRESRIDTIAFSLA